MMLQSLAGSPTESSEELLTGNQYTELVAEGTEDVEQWEFPGWGTETRWQLKEYKEGEDGNGASKDDEPHMLGQAKATAIAGNDITSSCLYVSGLCAKHAGKYAPLSLSIVAVTLYLFRWVYSEVGGALPLNGGAYNVLLNTTRKTIASVAAALTLLSYLATAVVSASEAAEYMHNGLWSVDVMLMTVFILGLFSVLNLMGISESANAALAIFTLHLTTLGILMVSCVVYMGKHGDHYSDNWHKPDKHSPVTSLFYGFAAAMLGVSGFESSANYIEEQKKGVFPKTLRNMWFAVSVLNPGISLLSLGVLPLHTIEAHNKTLLVKMGNEVAGEWLGKLISADAALVLSGAVLTSYVGVNGLMSRMAFDRVLPAFFLSANKWRSTRHYIIVGFFLASASLYLIVDGNVGTLAGVYTIAFLSVMMLFALGDMLLKYKRQKLLQTVKHRSNWGQVLVAFVLAWLGLLGNVMLTPKAVLYFSLYFAVVGLGVAVMFTRYRVMKILLFFAKRMLVKFRGSTKKEALSQGASHWINRKLLSVIGMIRSQKVAFLVKTDTLHVLHKGILYVRENEDTRCIKIVHIYNDESKIPPKLVENVAFLDKCFPKFRIDLLLCRGEFSPAAVNEVSERLDVPKNFIFLTAPSMNFGHHLPDFGGVRVITH